MIKIVLNDQNVRKWPNMIKMTKNDQNDSSNKNDRNDPKWSKWPNRIKMIRSDKKIRSYHFENANATKYDFFQGVYFYMHDSWFVFCDTSDGEDQVTKVVFRETADKWKINHETNFAVSCDLLTHVWWVWCTSLSACLRLLWDLDGAHLFL